MIFPHRKGMILHGGGGALRQGGITAVHGKVMSEGTREYLERRGISCTFETLTNRIINRSGTNICPMEKAMSAINDENEGYHALLIKWNELRA